MCVSRSVVFDSAIPWTVAHKAALSMGFSRQEYTEELHKKDLHDPDNHDGVVTHLEPDILECGNCQADEQTVITQLSRP